MDTAVDQGEAVGDAAHVGFDDKALRALERVARELNERSPEQVVHRAVERAKAVGVRVLDDLVSRLAGRRVHTRPVLRIDAGDASWVARAVAGTPASARWAAAPRPDATARTDDGAPTESAAVVAVVEVVAPAEVEATPHVEATPVSAAPGRETETETATTEPETAAPDAAPPETAAPDAHSTRPSDTPPNLVAPSTTEPLPALPARYGIDRVVLLAGDSEWVFAYWETDPARLGDASRAELRLLTDDGALVGRAYVDPTQGRQHLRVPARGRRYLAELVRLDGTPLSRSRAVFVRAPEST